MQISYLPLNTPPVDEFYLTGYLPRNWLEHKFTSSSFNLFTGRILERSAKIEGWVIHFFAVVNQFSVDCHQLFFYTFF